VSLDHAETIGPTLVDIATEKAGIVKPGSTLVLGERDQELAEIFRGAGAAEVWAATVRRPGAAEAEVQAAAVQRLEGAEV